MTTSAPSRIDVRQIPPRERHPLIFSTFRNLRPGSAMHLVNDHDPLPLYYQFEAEASGTFSWDCEQAGPEVWQVRITKLAVQPSQAAGSCCGGGCGGAG
jgi:uncharacterized protein (DUF2249 family)